MTNKNKPELEVGLDDLEDMLLVNLFFQMSSRMKLHIPLIILLCSFTFIIFSQFYGNIDVRYIRRTIDVCFMLSSALFITMTAKHVITNIVLLKASVNNRYLLLFNLSHVLAFIPIAFTVSKLYGFSFSEYFSNLHFLLPFYAASLMISELTIFIYKRVIERRLVDFNFEEKEFTAKKVIKKTVINDESDLEKEIERLESKIENVKLLDSIPRDARNKTLQNLKRDFGNKTEAEKKKLVSYLKHNIECYNRERENASIGSPIRYSMMFFSFAVFAGNILSNVHDSFYNLLVILNYTLPSILVLYIIYREIFDKTENVQFRSIVDISFVLSLLIIILINIFMFDKMPVLMLTVIVVFMCFVPLLALHACKHYIDSESIEWKVVKEYLEYY